MCIQWPYYGLANIPILLRQKHQLVPKFMCLFFSFHTCTTTSCKTVVDCTLQRPQFSGIILCSDVSDRKVCVCVFNQHVLSTAGWEAAASKTNGRATMLPLFPQFSCLSENDLPVTEHNLASPSHSPAPFTTTTTTFPQHTDTHPLTPTHAHRPHLLPSWTRSTSAQRNSFSNFPWLRKQYTCLNNVDISNALKRSSNGALIGSKWLQDYKHT